MRWRGLMLVGSWAAWNTAKSSPPGSQRRVSRRSPRGRSRGYPPRDGGEELTTLSKASEDSLIASAQALYRRMNT
jgi:hypothetical protein